jgi:hypothetical protein
MSDIVLSVAQLLGAVNRLLGRRPLLAILRLGLVALIAVALPLVAVAVELFAAVGFVSTRALFWAAYLIHRFAPAGTTAVNHSTKAGDKS